MARCSHPFNFQSRLLCDPRDDVMGSPGNRRENRHFHGNWSAPSLLYGIEKSSEEGTARKTSYSLSRWSSCRIKFLAGSPAVPSLRLSQISRCPEASTTRSSLSSTDFLKATLESLLCAVYKWKIEDSFFYSLCRFDDAKWTTDREKEFKCSLCCDVFQDCFSSFFSFFFFFENFYRDSPDRYSLMKYFALQFFLCLPFAL